MRNKYLIIIAFLLLSSQVYSQSIGNMERGRDEPAETKDNKPVRARRGRTFRFGFKAGIGLTKFTKKDNFDPETESNIKVGFMLGGILQYNLNKMFGIQLGAYIQSTNGLWKNDYDETSINFVDLVISIAPVIKFRNIALLIGLEIPINLSATEELKYKDFKISIPDVNKPFINFVAGIYFLMQGRGTIMVGFEFKHGILQVAESLDGVYQTGYYLCVGMLL